MDDAFHITDELDDVATLNFAILGAGRIAHTMAKTVSGMQDDPRWSGKIRLYGVATRDNLERAEEFAAQYDIPHAFGSYESMLDEPEIDIVYVATPHALHAQCARMCMEAGKHVLVEKAFTANASQARELVELSKSTGLACVEAIWTRYMPSREIIANCISSGMIGEVKSISANLSYPITGKARLVDPHLAGGALLDVGVYPLNFIDMFAGVSSSTDAKITAIDSSARMTDAGVDEIDQATLWYDNGVVGDMTSSMSEVGDRLGIIRGSLGVIRVENINNPERIDVYDKNYTLVASYDVPEQITGFEYEVDAIMKAIYASCTDTDFMTHDKTVQILEYCDQIRAQWNMVYPFEK